MVLLFCLSVLSFPASALDEPVAGIDVCDGESCTAARESVELLTCKETVFQASAYDKNNTYEWLIGNERKGTGEKFRYTPGRSGESRLWLDVKGPSGEDLTSLRLIVEENKPPQLERVEIKRLESGEEVYYSSGSEEKIIVGVNSTLVIRREYAASDDNLTPKVVIDKTGVTFNGSCKESVCEISLRFLEKGNFSITVKDTDICSYADDPTELNVWVIENEQPTADISGQLFVKERETIQLSGSRSKTGGDKDDKIVQYCWKFVPFGKEAGPYDWKCSDYSDISAPGEYDLYEVFLIVKDLYGGTNQTTEIAGYERAYNRAPKCNQAPSLTVRQFDTVTLYGSNCRDDHRIVRYKWEVYRISPEGRKLVGEINTTNVKVNFSRFNWTGTYVIEQTVTDDGDLPSEYGDTAPLSGTSTREVLVINSTMVQETQPPAPTPTAISTVKKEESKPAVSVTTTPKEKPPSGPPGLTNQEIVVGFIFAIIVIAILYRWNERRKKRLGRK